jgi:hypothetical protein
MIWDPGTTADVTDQDGNPVPITWHGGGSYSLVAPEGCTSIGPWPRFTGGESFEMVVGRECRSGNDAQGEGSAT